MAEPINMPFGGMDSGGLKKPCIRRRSRSPMRMDNFKGQGGQRGGPL